MTEKLTNVVVKYAKVETGTNSRGPWKRCDFTITDPAWDGIWFAWFLGGEKPEPCIGMEIKELGYEVVEKGEYTNYNVKKLILPAGGEAAPANPKPRPQTKPGPAPAPGQAYIKHSEAVCELMKMASSPAGEIDRPVYEKLLNAFKFGIRVLTTDTVLPKQEPEPEEIPEDDIPF